MPVTAPEAFVWHARPGAIQRLLPPWANARIIEQNGTIRDGDRVSVALKTGPVEIKSVYAHDGYIEGQQFTDHQISGPMRQWRHTHRFLTSSADPGPCSTLSDSIEYALPGGALGNLLLGARASRELDRLFEFRHARTRQDLARHAVAKAERAGTAGLLSAPGPMRIVMTGASGAIGRELRHFLTTGGHNVQRLVRRKADAAAGEVFWQPGPGPRGGQIDEAALEGCHAVIHLAGESITNGRWSEEKKKAIRESRIDGTRLIARTIANLKQRPQVLVTASGIHYYGDRGEQELTEDSGIGSGFLAEVSRDWEAADAPARDAGVRVVNLRIGLVLAARGGIVPSFLSAARFGLGCVLGDGRQWWSWIGQDDLLGVILHALTSPHIRGAVNAVTPQPARMHEIATALADLVDRPLLARVPAFALGALLREKAEIITSSTRAVPNVLRQSGFRFMYPGLVDALNWEISGTQRADATA